MSMQPGVEMTGENTKTAILSEKRQYRSFLSWSGLHSGLDFVGLYYTYNQI